MEDGRKGMDNFPRMDNPYLPALTNPAKAIY